MSPSGLMLALALTASACAVHDAPSVVVALAPPSAIPVAPAESFPSCTIMGDGELVENEWEERPELGLYGSARDKEPVFTVEKTDEVGIAWSELPLAHDPSSTGFAAVALGNQSRIAVHAWSKLAGRRFQLRTAGDVVPEHMWIDRGVPVEVLGTHRGQIVVRRATGFDAPAWFEASVACGMMAYDPKAIDPPREEDVDDGLVPLGAQLELRTRPAGEVFVTVRPGEGSIAFAARETSGEWVHLRWHERGLGLDGWARRSELDEGAGGMLGLGGIGMSGGSGGPLRTVTVARPARVLLGEDHHPFSDATFERGARLDVWGTSGDLLEVTLEDKSISSREEMWIDRRAVEDR